ncbi:Ter macrodomain-binding protein MatP [Psittacicella hinzii]|uniref:Macrodomain Ter protein n=1 Tax=Psittacicella hinzii TaxID=2028575 RepID=A0A3A1YNN1_9GAMM|nr:Ter macrodomain-binding protein MatP [Psittacicella hinzii]RIY39086.1 hypothetical protein CKF58_02825 [Psittacicella hinzii]
MLENSKNRLYRKHQKLPTHEAKWKWDYLYNKYLRGENITKYIEAEIVREISLELINAKNKPELIDGWIAKHLNENLHKKLQQALRAKRKRFHDNEKILFAKKTIDLEFKAWHQLSELSRDKEISLSEAIQLLFDLVDKEKLAAYHKPEFALIVAMNEGEEMQAAKELQAQAQAQEQTTQEELASSEQVETQN